MATKKGAGLGARMAGGRVDDVAAGIAATLVPPQAEEEAKAGTVALNVRLPRDLHKRLRQVAFDQETSITAILIQGAEKMLAELPSK